MILKGVSASPGIAIGPAFLLDSQKVRVIRRRLDEGELEDEKRRFRDAVAGAEDEISALLHDIPEELRDHSGILRSHLMMLKDPMVFDRTLKTIESKSINAEWALSETLDHVRSLFKEVKDPYIRERMGDIEYVIQSVQDILTGSPPSLDFSSLEHPVVLVAHDLSPADTVQMSREKILAFVTEMGSRTSHTAILARSLGIPAVVGIENVTSAILSGELLVVDGLKGEVVVDPDEVVLKEYEEKQQGYIKYRLEVIHHSNLPAETRDGYRVKIKANMELLDEIPSLISHGAEGVGLFRTEFLYLAQKELPDEETLFHAYKEVAERLSPYPVTVRTLDIGGDKFVSSVSLDEEINPALGLRAIRLCLKERALFRDQLRAILRASAYGDVRILFPLISGRMEILEVKEILEKTKEELRAEGIKFDEDIRMGIMIEVPTAVLVADVLAKEVDFFSIGTNDLIQYSLAIDRVNEHVAHLYEPLHPGVIRMLHRTVEAAHAAGIEVAMCGEMAGEPRYVPILLGLGLDELSMNAMAIPKVKRVVRRCRQDDCAELAHHILDSSTADEIKQRLGEFLKDKLPEEFDPIYNMVVDLERVDSA